MAKKISLCMIVRNEEQNLRRCLKSVAGIVDEIIIVDTGSKDATCQIALEFGAIIRSVPWHHDFSEARNASLDIATGEWILFLDADEELTRESIEALRIRTNSTDADGYFIKVINYIGNDGWTETCPDLVFRLFRNHPDYRFRGAIHEQIADVILEKNPHARYQIAEEITIVHFGYLDEQIQTKNKKERNLKIIEKELLEKPHDKLLRYHYGVELFRAERFAEAAQELTQAANELDPHTIYLPKLLRYIVLAHQSAGNHAQALNVIQLGLKYFPNYADLYYYGGLICLELKKYGSAKEWFQQAVAMPEQPPQFASFGGVRGFRSYYHLGQIAEMFLDYEEALKFYILSLKDNPHFIPSLEKIVQILKPSQNPEDTEESLAKIIEFCTPEAHEMIGEIFFRQGAYALALKHFEQIGENHELLPQIRLWKAICLCQEYRYLECLRILEDFPVNSPLYPLAKINILICFWLQNRPQKVRMILQELIPYGLSPETGKVLTLLVNSLDSNVKGHILSLEQDGIFLLLEIIQRLVAMNEVNRALNLLHLLKPECLYDYTFHLAEIFYDYKQFEHAKSLLETYFLQEAENPQAQRAEAHYLLAEIYKAEEHFIQAEAHYRLALETAFEVPKYYVSLIHLYTACRQEIIQEAARKYPEDETWRRLAEEVSTP